MIFPFTAVRQVSEEISSSWDKCRLSLVGWMPVSEASSGIVKGGVFHPDQARQRSRIQVTSTAAGSCWLKIMRVGTKIPRGGRRGDSIGRLTESFHRKSNRNE